MTASVIYRLAFLEDLCFGNVEKNYVNGFSVKDSTFFNWLILSIFLLLKKIVLNCSRKSLAMLPAVFLYRPNIPVRQKSSYSQMFFKIGVLKNFSILTEEHPRWILFLKKLQACNFSKKRLQQVFSCKYCKICNNSFLIEHLCWLFQKTDLVFYIYYLRT